MIEPHNSILQLRRLRRMRKIKQYELARTIGVDTTLVSQWETGRRNPSWFNLICWAEALGAEIHFKETGNGTKG